MEIIKINWIVHNYHRRAGDRHRFWWLVAGAIMSWGIFAPAVWYGLKWWAKRS